MPQLKLLYLPVRARAEAIRMALAYADVKYENITVGFGERERYKEDGLFLHGQSPVLIVDGTPLPQSSAILRYVAETFGLAPKDALQRALCDSVYELSAELTQGPRNVNPIVNMFTGDKLEQARAAYFAEFSRYPPIFAKLLADKKFFMGDEVTYADFGVWHVLDNTRTLDPEALKGHPTLEAFMERVAQLPGVAAYLRCRPPLEQLGRNLIRA